MKLPTAICLVTLLAMPVLALAGEMKMEMGELPPIRPLRRRCKP